VLLAEVVADREVSEGALGCPNCRDAFPIHRTIADLRPPPRAPLGEPLEVGVCDPEKAIRIAAALGIVDGSGIVLLLGAGAAGCAGPVSELLPDIQWVAATAAPVESSAVVSVTRLIYRGSIPLHDSVVRAAICDPRHGLPLRELRRTLLPGGRVIVTPRGSIDPGQFEEAGFTVIVDEDAALVLEKG